MIKELGGLSGAGVKTKDGHGPFSGRMDPEFQDLRDVLSGDIVEIPARTAPTHQQMVSRPTGAGGTGPVEMDPSAVAQAGSAFLPLGVDPSEFDTPPEDLRRTQPTTPTAPASSRVGSQMNRPRTPRQEFDPAKMLSPAELDQAKKQLGLEGNMPKLQDAAKYHHNVRTVLDILKQAKEQGWVEKMLQAVPELQQLVTARRPNDVEKAFELSFRELAKLVPRN